MKDRNWSVTEFCRNIQQALMAFDADYQIDLRICSATIEKVAEAAKVGEVQLLERIEEKGISIALLSNGNFYYGQE